MYDSNIIGIIKIPDGTPITRIHTDEIYDKYVEYNDSSDDDINSEYEKTLYINLQN